MVLTHFVLPWQCCSVESAPLLGKILVFIGIVRSWHWETGLETYMPWCRGCRTAHLRALSVTGLLHSSSYISRAGNHALYRGLKHLLSGEAYRLGVLKKGGHLNLDFSPWTLAVPFPQHFSVGMAIGICSLSWCLQLSPWASSCADYLKTVVATTGTRHLEIGQVSFYIWSSPQGNGNNTSDLQCSLR